MRRRPWAMWWASLTVTLRVASKKDEDDVLTLGVDQREHLDDELVPEVGRILVDTPACSTSVRWTLVEHSWNTRGTLVEHVGPLGFI